MKIKLSKKAKKIIKYSCITAIGLGAGALTFYLLKSYILRSVGTSSKLSEELIVNLKKDYFEFGVKNGSNMAAKKINDALSVIRWFNKPDSTIGRILKSEGIEGLLKYAEELRKFRGW